MRTHAISHIAKAGMALAIAFYFDEASAQQDFAQSMAPIFRQIVPADTRCYFATTNGNAICEFTVTNGNGYDTLRLEAGQFDIPTRVRSIELIQTTTDRNSPEGVRQMNIVKDFVARYNFTYNQMVSCMRAGIQGFWQSIAPPTASGGGLVTIGGMTMRCTLNPHAPNERGATTTIDLQPAKGPNEF